MKIRFPLRSATAPAERSSIDSVEPPIPLGDCNIVGIGLDRQNLTIRTDDFRQHEGNNALVGPKSKARALGRNAECRSRVISAGSVQS